MLRHWSSGFWGLLTFSMQVVATLLFGYVLATSPVAHAGIAKVGRLPRNAGQVILLVACLAIFFGLINWAVGLIVGAISAKELCKEAKARGIRVHFPLAAAAGFSALLINVVLSASAPLLVNTPGHFLEAQIGLIPITETILTPYSLITVSLYFLIIPFVVRAMMPRNENVVEIDESGSRDPLETVTSAGSSKEPRTFAEKLENSRLLTAIPVLAGLIYLILYFSERGFDLNLNIVNFTLLIAGLVCYKTPGAYVRAVDNGIRSCGQIVLQFPFYAGIMGMMSHSGMVEVMAGWMISISTPESFPFMTLLSAGMVNLFVPSAGGQWAVQGPVLIEAAKALNVDLGLTIMAFTYGDQLTNGIQPMWMLPLLGIVSLKARDILGYTAVMMGFAFFIFAFGLTVLPHLFT